MYSSGIQTYNLTINELSVTNIEGIAPNTSHQVKTPFIRSSMMATATTRTPTSEKFCTIMLYSSALIRNNLRSKLEISRIMIRSRLVLRGSCTPNTGVDHALNEN